MSEDILAVLRKHYDLLNVQYEEHLEAVRELQKTLILQILPGLVDELDMDEDGQQYCLEWLEDSCASPATLPLCCRCSNHFCQYRSFEP